MTTSHAHPLLHEHADIGAARLAARHRGHVSEETVRALIADSYQRLAASARVSAHLHVLAERFAAERLEALLAAEQPPATRPARVLFVCGQNSGRSQIAAALLTHRATEPVTVTSAGTDPASEIETHLDKILNEVGAHLGTAYPKPLTREIIEAADIVVTLGCGDACPVVPGRRYLDWPTPDPRGASPADLRHIRDTINTHVSDLLDLLAAPAPVTSDPEQRRSL